MYLLLGAFSACFAEDLAQDARVMAVVQSADLETYCAMGLSMSYLAAHCFECLDPRGQATMTRSSKPAQSMKLDDLSQSPLFARFAARFLSSLLYVFFCGKRSSYK